MRTLLFLVCFAVLSSSACENSEVTDSSTGNTSEMKGTLAIVTTEFADEGCSFLLEIEENDEKVLLMPIELDEKFQKNGLKVSIEFHSSKIAQGECQMGRPIVLDRISIIRKQYD